MAEKILNNVVAILMVITVVVISFSTACLEDWNNQCRSDGHCCSNYCWRGNPDWETGVCQPQGRNMMHLHFDMAATQGSASTITRDQFNRAVTQNGFPTPRSDQFVAFKNGLARGQITTKTEAAMALAQFIHESGGLVQTREASCKNNGCPGSYRTPGCDAPGRYYYGRGYIQLSWCGNYRSAGKDLGLGDQLVQNPDRVANEEQLAWNTAFSFWKREVRNGKYGAEVQRGMFGSSTRAINGQREECQGNGKNYNQSKKRFSYYKVAFKAFGCDGQPDERGCPY